MKEPVASGQRESRGYQWRCNDSKRLIVDAGAGSFAPLYTPAELESMRRERRRFAAVVDHETDWVFEREEG